MTIKQNGLVERFNTHITSNIQNVVGDYQSIAQLVSAGTRWVAAHEEDIAKVCALTWANSSASLVNGMDKILNSKSPFEFGNYLEPMYSSLAQLVIEFYLRMGHTSILDSNLLSSILTPHKDAPASLIRAKNEWMPLLQQQIILTGMDRENQKADAFEARVKNIILSAEARMDEIVHEIKGTNSKLEEFENEKLRQIIKAAEEKLRAYQEQAKKLESRFSFVSIAGAFRDMGDIKQKELKSATTVMIILALVALAPLVLSLITALKATSLTHYEFTLTLDQAIPRFLVILPLEIILIYFFRIALKNQLSIQAQLLQLQLRYSVCAFIEGYAEFAKGLEKEKLEKFEALVFSGLSPNPDNVPSTFDGMDQLINLVKATKSAS